jgi:hypothetical protein
MTAFDRRAAVAGLIRTLRGHAASSSFEALAYWTPWTAPAHSVAAENSLRSRERGDREIVVVRP